MESLKSLQLHNMNFFSNVIKLPLYEGYPFIPENAVGEIFWVEIRTTEIWRSWTRETQQTFPVKDTPPYVWTQMIKYLITFSCPCAGLSCPVPIERRTEYIRSDRFREWLRHTLHPCSFWTFYLNYDCVRVWSILEWPFKSLWTILKGKGSIPNELSCNQLLLKSVAISCYCTCSFFN